MSETSCASAPFATQADLGRSTWWPMKRPSSGLSLHRKCARTDFSTARQEDSGTPRSSWRTPIPGACEQVLGAHQLQIQTWLQQEGLLLTKVHELLGQGCRCPMRRRTALRRSDVRFGSRSSITVRRRESAPGEVADLGVQLQAAGPAPQCLREPGEVAGKR